MFRELEHLKTTARIIATRMKKKQSSKEGMYPIKIEVFLNRADLSKNNESIRSTGSEANLRIYYKMDNGKEVLKSDLCNDVLYPSWDNVFTITMENSHERLYFEAVIMDIVSKTEKVIDTFDISASIFEQHLKLNEELTDNISTSAANQFTLIIRNSEESNSKMQLIKSKIEKNEELLLQVEPPYKEARAKFESFLVLKGVELLDEWGICKNEFKLVKKHKNGNAKGKNEESKAEEAKVSELDLDQHDRSYLNRVLTTKTPKKSMEKASKHYFPKLNAAQKYAAPITQVNLQDLCDEEPSGNGNAASPKETLEEKLRKMAEKGLKKSNVGSAPASEGLEDPVVKSPQKLKSKQTEKAVNGLTPSKKIDLEDEVVEKSAESQRLTSTALRMSNLGTKRSGLGSSLINFAMEDVARVNKVKSVYNERGKPSMNVGGIFKQLDLSNTLSGMLMMNNGLGGGQVYSNNHDEDNCSLLSGNTMQTFQHFPNPLMMATGSRLSQH